MLPAFLLPPFLHALVRSPEVLVCLHSGWMPTGGRPAGCLLRREWVLKATCCMTNARKQNHLKNPPHTPPSDQTLSLLSSIIALLWICLFLQFEVVVGLHFEAPESEG